MGIAGQLSIDGSELEGNSWGDAVLEHEQRIAEKLTSATTEQLAGWLIPAEARQHLAEGKLALIENFVQDMKARLPGIERDLEAARCELKGAQQNVTKVREQLERAA